MKVIDWIRLGAEACLLIVIAVLIIIVIARGNTIEEKQELLDDIKLQHEIEMSAIREEAEHVKKEAKIRIENMPADAVAIEFLSDDDILQRADITDEIAREIITHQLEFFREMGINLVTISGKSVQ